MDVSIEEDGNTVEINLHADNIDVNCEEESAEDAEEEKSIQCAGEGVFGRIDPGQNNTEVDSALQEGGGILMEWIMEQGGLLDSEAIFIKRACRGEHYFRSHKSWLEEERISLLYLTEERGLSIGAIAQRLGRSESAIRSRVDRDDFKVGERKWYRGHKEDWGEIEEEIAGGLLASESRSKSVRWDIPKVAFLLGRSCSAVKDRKPQVRETEGHNKQWTALEWGQLLYHKREKERGNDQVSRKLGRTENAIRSQLSRLNKLNGHGVVDKLEEIGRAAALGKETPPQGQLESLEKKTRELLSKKV